MNSFLQSFRAAANQAPRLYFAPLLGIIRALQAEWIRLDREQAKEEIKEKADLAQHPSS